MEQPARRIAGGDSARETAASGGVAEGASGTCGGIQPAARQNTRDLDANASGGMRAHLPPVHDSSGTARRATEIPFGTQDRKRRLLSRSFALAASVCLSWIQTG